MKIIRKLGLVLIVLIVLFALAACLPGGGGGEPGGTVLIGGEDPGAGAQAGAGTTQAPAAGQQAAAEQPAGGGAGFGLFLPIILMFGVMWLLVIRPQRKQAKATAEMQSSLSVGDNVVTTSGFFGKIVGAGTDSFLVEFGEGRGFKVWVRKSDIAGVKTPMTTTPSASDAEIKDKDKDKDKDRDKDKGK